MFKKLSDEAIGGAERFAYVMTAFTCWLVAGVLMIVGIPLCAIIIGIFVVMLGGVVGFIGCQYMWAAITGKKITSDTKSSDPIVA